MTGRSTGRVARIVMMVAVILIAAADRACADKRVALIIGNSKYQAVPSLNNPARDAKSVAELFQNAKFDSVDLRLDLDNRDIRRAIVDFQYVARDSDIAVVYFAGHGVEVGGKNYLIPTDATLLGDLDVEDEALPVSRLLTAIEAARQLRLIILDACRENLKVASKPRTRAIGRGFVKDQLDDDNTLIAYATKAGLPADDGAGTHSPYTTALLAHIGEPGLDVRFALGKVRDEVVKLTKGRQTPYFNGSLGGESISLIKPVVHAVAAAGASTPSPPADRNQNNRPAPGRNAELQRDYEKVEHANTKNGWKSFLAMYDSPSQITSKSDELLVILARDQLAKILDAEKAQNEAAEAKVKAVYAELAKTEVAKAEAAAQAKAAAAAKQAQIAAAERAKVAAEAEQAKAAAAELAKAEAAKAAVAAREKAEAAARQAQIDATEKAKIAALAEQAKAKAQQDAKLQADRARNEPQIAKAPEPAKASAPGSTRTASVCQPGAPQVIASAAPVGGPFAAAQIEPNFAAAKEIRTIAVASDGSKFATAGDDGAVRLWDAKTFRLLFSSPRTGATIFGLSFSKDGNLIASAGWDGKIRVWDIGARTPSQNPAVVFSADNEKGAVKQFGAVFSGDQKQLASFGADGVVRLWNLDRKVLDKKIPSHVGAKDPTIHALAFAPNRPGEFATAGFDGTVRIFLANGKVETVKAFTGKALHLVYSPSGDLLGVTGRNTDKKDKNVNFFDVSGAGARAPKLVLSASGHTDYAVSIAWSSDGKQILTGGGYFDPTLRLWDATGALVHTYKGHIADVETVAFHPNGKWLISAGEDKTIKIWDTRTETNILTIVAFDDGQYLAYTPNGCYTGSADIARHVKVSAQGVGPDVADQMRQALFVSHSDILALLGR